MHYLQCTSQTFFVQIYFEQDNSMQLFSVNVILRLIAKWKKMTIPIFDIPGHKAIEY